MTMTDAQLEDSTRPRRFAFATSSIYLVAAAVQLTQELSFGIATLLAFGAYVAIGNLILLRRSGNLVGAALALYGTLWALGNAGLATADSFEATGNAATAAAITIPTGIVTSAGIWIISTVWLLFPDGRLSTPLDRKLLIGSAVVAVITAVLGIFAAPQALPETTRYDHPFVNDSLADSLRSAHDALLVGMFFFGYLVAARVVLRYRHGDPVERRQAGWIAVAAIFAITVLFGNAILQPLGTDTRAFLLIDSVAVAAIPLAIGVAIFRYRLYDIDVIISKSVTYLGLAAVVSGLYALVVVLPLFLLGRSETDGPGVLLPILATAVVAIAFEPVRSRLERFANRLVYGNRTSPHEVLAQVTGLLADERPGAATHDVARLLAEGTGADHATVWLADDGTLTPDGAWPTGSVGSADMAADITDAELAMRQPVVHLDETFGAIGIMKPKNDPLTPADRELVADVAAGSGLLLRNIRLNRDLVARADDVRQSRRRLIAAQDAQRRRLERDLHDGAQQRVVALKVKLGIARTLAQREGADALDERLAGLATAIDGAVDELRGVAHGIYPPLLETEGLPVALQALERTSTSTSIPVEVQTVDIERYDRSVEETAYFCVVETLQQARMSGAERAWVKLAGDDADLRISLRLTGGVDTADLTAIVDRVDAVGGHLETTVAADDDRVVSVRLPLIPVEHQGALA